ncbi:hypothetical protein KKH3_28520 [Pectobacterium actinidiae]|nr:hypothetical protein KKH3_28520 [Pectobacterium actinidiae]
MRAHLFASHGFVHRVPDVVNDLFLPSHKAVFSSEALVGAAFL